MPFIPGTLTERQSPYGVVGTRYAGTTDAAEALSRSGLDWTAKIVDTQAVYLSDTGVSTRIHEDKRSTIKVRPDGSWAPLSVVGTSYHPFQNHETASLLQNLADSSEGEFIAGGEIDGGRKTFMQMALPEGVMIGGRDRMDMTVIIFNSFDGSGRLLAVPTATRPACTNQFPAIKRAAEFSFSAKHTENALRVGVADIRAALNLTFAAQQEIVAIGNELISAPMTTAEFTEFVKDVHAPKPDPKRPGLELKSSVTFRQALSNTFAHATNLSEVRGTRWAALQTIIEGEDWIRSAKGDHGHELRMINRPALQERVKSHALELLTAH